MSHSDDVSLNAIVHGYSPNRHPAYSAAPACRVSLQCSLRLGSTSARQAPGAHPLLEQCGSLAHGQYCSTHAGVSRKGASTGTLGFVRRTSFSLPADTFSPALFDVAVVIAVYADAIFRLSKYFSRGICGASQTSFFAGSIYAQSFLQKLACEGERLGVVASAAAVLHSPC